MGNVIKEFIVGWSKLEETRIVPDFQDFCRRNRRNILLAIRITLNAIVFNAILQQRNVVTVKTFVQNPIGYEKFRSIQVGSFSPREREKKKRGYCRGDYFLVNAKY